jgi:acyl carrier protein
MKLFEQQGLELEKELLEMIVDVCKIPDPVPDDFSPDDPLIGPDSVLGLDSLDAVEIVVVVEKRYHVRISVDETSRVVFRSTRMLAEYIRRQLPATPQ